MTGIQQLIPRFKFGATILDFPDPSMTPEAACAAFIPNYPFLRTATIGDPIPEGPFLTYPLRKPDVQVKGAACAADALAALDNWRESNDRPNMETHMLVGHALHGVVQSVLKRPQSPITDAFLIPMA